MGTISRPEKFRAVRSHFIDKKVESTLETLSIADLSSGDVIVKNQYAGVNYKDCLAILGRAKIMEGFPRVAGIESVGVVVESAVEQFVPGQSVMVHGFQTGMRYDGGFAEYLNVPAGHLMPVPAELSPLEAAIIGVPGFTVAMVMDRFESLGITPDKGTVAVSGATGAVGMLALLMLSGAGYEIHAISRRVNNPALKQLGASQVIDANLALEALRPIEAPRYVAAIDNVAGPVLSWLLRSLQENGALASVGNASGSEFNCNVLPFILRNVNMFGIVANAPWALREKLWRRLSAEWRPDFKRLESHLRFISLDGLLAYSEEHLKGQTSGRTLIRFD